LHVRHIEQLHQALGNLKRELDQSADKSRFVEHQARIAEIESAMRSLKVARSFEVDLQLLRFHLREVQDHVGRIAAADP
jgi:tRNA U34 5-carboxymethylaminomethyl modifying GTPase MnmE/TrmE